MKTYRPLTKREHILLLAEIVYLKEQLEKCGESNRGLSQQVAESMLEVRKAEILCPEYAARRKAGG